MKTDRRAFIATLGAAALAAFTRQSKGAEMKASGTITIRKSNKRGIGEHGWLHSRHSFSFANYYDPNFMEFHALRVINDDRVEAGQGFGTHPHQDMEIVTYVVDGALEHKDSMGNGSIIRPNDVQRMSAGSGITHSEFNPQKDAAVHFLQIWLQPKEKGIEPSYEQKTYTAAEKTNRLRLVASPDGADGSVTIHQDARMYACLLEPKAKVVKPATEGRHVWIQVVKGKLDLNGHALETGDGAAIENAGELTLTGISHSDILIFDLA
jgi:redox-sensitive bicupin YhaK (pirin superfamily)